MHKLRYGFLLLIANVKVLVAQSCQILCDSLDCSPPGSSVHDILQARILEWFCHFLLQALIIFKFHAASCIQEVLKDAHGVILVKN